MKKGIILLAALIVFAGIARAQSTDTGEKAKTSESKTTAMICPVTGEDADPEVSYTYEGTTYHFCCNGCVAKFKKDPGKYIQASHKQSFDKCADHGENKGAADGSEAKAGSEEKTYTVQIVDDNKGVINEGKDLSAEISNSICPVMGKKVDKKVTTVTYKGKVYGFCCKSCIKKFANNPVEYLSE
jgi:P-type Cu+ transporter